MTPGASNVEKLEEAIRSSLQQNVETLDAKLSDVTNSMQASHFESSALGRGQARLTHFAIHKKTAACLFVIPRMDTRASKNQSRQRAKKPPVLLPKKTKFGAGACFGCDSSLCGSNRFNNIERASLFNCRHVRSIKAAQSQASRDNQEARLALQTAFNDSLAAQKTACCTVVAYHAPMSTPHIVMNHAPI